MKLLLATLLLTSLQAQPAAQPPQASQAVLAPIQNLFAAMTARDPATIRATFLPEATLLAIHEGKTTQFTVDAFVDRIAKVPPMRVEERIHDPLVRIDRDVAVVWAPYDFLMAGKVDHCGTDLFNLVLIDGQWRIASITWNSVNTCPAPH